MLALRSVFLVALGAYAKSKTRCVAALGIYATANKVFVATLGLYARSKIQCLVILGVYTSTIKSFLATLGIYAGTKKRLESMLRLNSVNSTLVVFAEMPCIVGRWSLNSVLYHSSRDSREVITVVAALHS